MTESCFVYQGYQTDRHVYKDALSNRPILLNSPEDASQADLDSLFTTEFRILVNAS